MTARPAGGGVPGPSAGGARWRAPDPRHLRARRGEDAAAAALRERGYRIVARNVRLRRGELDIIAEDHGTLVFVEVKTRRSRAYGTPAEAVTPAKRRALATLALAYLGRRGLCGRACRFDVVEVWLDAADRVARLEVLRDAFGAW